MRKKPLPAVGLVVFLGGCAGSPCLLVQQKPALLISLYFGRDIGGHRAVGEAAWKDFAERVITPAFPRGFTVYNARGQWQDGASGVIVREDSRVVQVADAPGSDLAARVAHVIDVYKREFQQGSVGIVTSPACAAF